MKALLTSPLRHPIASVVVAVLALVVGWTSFRLGKQAWGERRLDAAQAALDRQDFERALAEFELVLGQWPDWVEVRFQAARAARRADQLDKAEMYLAQVEQAGHIRLSADIDVEFERACLRAQQGDIEEVLGFLNNKIKHRGSAALLAQEALILGYAALRQVDGITQVDKLFQEAPHQLSPRLVRIKFFHSNQQYDNMVTECRTIMAIFPEAYWPRLWLARGFQHLGKTREAVAEYRILSETYPDRPEGVVGLASCRAELHQFDQAQALLDRVLTKHPEHFEALLERGRLTLRIGKPEEGEPFLRRALKVEPSNREAFTTLVQVLQKQKKTEEAAAVKKQQDDMEVAQGLVLRDFTLTPPVGLDDKLLVAARLDEVGRDDEALHLRLSVLSAYPRHRAVRQALADYFERKRELHRAAWHRKMMGP